MIARTWKHSWRRCVHLSACGGTKAKSKLMKQEIAYVLVFSSEHQPKKKRKKWFVVHPFRISMRVEIINCCDSGFWSYSKMKISCLLVLSAISKSTRPIWLLKMSRRSVLSDTAHRNRNVWLINVCWLEYKPNELSGYVHICESPCFILLHS